MTSAHMESRPPLAGFALLRTMADKLVARIAARSRSHSLWHSGFCLASHHLADTHAPMGGLRGSRRPFCLVGRGGRPAWPNGCALGSSSLALPALSQACLLSPGRASPHWCCCSSSPSGRSSSGSCRSGARFSCARIPSRTNVRASTVMPALVAGIHALLDGSPAHINIDGTSTRLSGKLRFS